MSRGRGKWCALCLGVLALACAPGVQAASISVRVEPAAVSVDEALHVFYEADGNIDVEPDLSPLEKDFRVVGQSSSREVYPRPGDPSVKTFWQLELMPRRAGALTIPALLFGSLLSDPATVRVRAASPPGANISSSYFVEAVVDEDAPYVQQQVVYTVRVYRTVRARASRLEQPAPEGVDALVEALNLGGAASYSTLLGGRRYDVYEQRHALYPQASGTLLLPPLEYAVRVVERGGTARTRIFRVRSNAIEVPVAEPPAGAPAPWLPARMLTLYESWESEEPVSVGDTVTRRIGIRAVGLTAEQLPELEMALPEGIKRYPLPAGLNNVSSGDGITGSRVQSVSLVATRPGPYTLPGVTLDWWNLDTGRAERAVLAPRTLVVAAAPAAAAAAGESPSGEAEGAGSVPAAGAGAAGWRWQWQSLSGGLALAWLLTLWRWRGERRRAFPAGAPSKRAPPPRAAQALATLRRSCAEHDARASRDALLAWSAALWPASPPSNLSQLARRCGGELAPAIDELQRALYAGDAGSWDGSSLWKAVQRVDPRPAAREAARGDSLQPLYRTRRGGPDAA